MTHSAPKPPLPRHSAQVSGITSLRQAFDAALTPEVLREITRHAERRAATLRGAAAWLSAEDLVHTAIVKTLDGSQRWKPEMRTLAEHLKGAIDGEISHARDHARDFPEVRIDAPDVDDAVAEEVAAAVARAPEAQAGVEHARAALFVAVGARARHDVAIRALLDAYERGAHTRREVIEVTGMTRREYAAAYARLRYVARKAELPGADLATRAADRDP